MEPNLDAAFRRYFPTIREKCARMLNDPVEAQDVAQETFIRLWRSSIARDDAPRVTGWIYATATRLAIDLMRRRRRQGAPVAEPPELPDGADLERAVAFRQQLDRLARRVPARELELAILERVDGLTQAEIAAVSGISDRTVRRVLTRFDERVRRLLESEANRVP